MSVHYLLTTQRFIHETGILRRVNDRIELLDMDDITFEQGLLERLVGVGTIRIASQRSQPSGTRARRHRERQARGESVRQRPARRAPPPRAACRADLKEGGRGARTAI